MTRWYKTQADAQATGVSFSLWPNRKEIKCAYKFSLAKKALNYVKKKAINTVILRTIAAVSAKLKRGFNLRFDQGKKTNT